MEDCLFCKIASGKLGSTKVYEDEFIYAFKDIHPVAPIHVLMVPKIHVQDLNDVNEENLPYVGAILKATKEVANICGVAEEGYRLISNCGENAGQVVGHLHFHLIGGKKLGAKIVKE